MIPVASLDAAMVLAETAEMPLHNLGVLLLEPPPRAEDDPYDSMWRTFEARLHHVPAFRRRIVQGPFRLGNLRWIEDPRFDLRNHLLRVTLPPPGGRAELAAFVGEYAGRLLDRDKPLWEIVLVEGLSSGEIAAVAKIHHAAMDGARLVALIEALFAEASERAPSDTWRPEREPGPARLVLDSARTLARKPGNVLRAAAEIGGAVVRSRDSRAPSRPGAREASRLVVPHTPWMGALSAHRAVAFADVRLEDVRAIRAAFGTTVNDVVLAASAGALRGWLLARDALPDVPLVANVPIAVKRPGDDAANQVSMLRVHLPTQEADPVERLLRIRAETARGKQEHHARGSNAYRRFTDLVLGLTVPALLTPVVRFYSSHRGGDFHPALWNVVISNIQGPDHALYYGGARVKRIYPIGPVQHGSGLNLTVMSTAGSLCLGALACREKVPHVEDIAAGFSEEVAILLRRSAARP